MSPRSPGESRGPFPVYRRLCARSSRQAANSPCRLAALDGGRYGPPAPLGRCRTNVPIRQARSTKVGGPAWYNLVWGGGGLSSLKGAEPMVFRRRLLTAIVLAVVTEVVRFLLRKVLG